MTYTLHLPSTDLHLTREASAGCLSASHRGDCILDSPWCGAIVATGYFKTADPYVDMAKVAPYAVDWQIKQSPFGEESDQSTDLVRLIQIFRASSYRGYLPIETLSPKNKIYDPFTVVPAFLKQLRDAIAQTG